MQFYVYTCPAYFWPDFEPGSLVTSATALSHTYPTYEATYRAQYNDKRNALYMVATTVYYTQFFPFFHSSWTTQNILHLTATEWTITAPDIPGWSRDPSSASPNRTRTHQVPCPVSGWNMTSVKISICDLNCADISLHIPYTTSWCGASIGFTFICVCGDGINAYGSVCFHCSLQLQGRNIRSRSESEVSDLQSRARRDRLSGSAI